VSAAAALLLLALGVAAPADAAQDEQWAYELSHNLMSPYCPGRTLSDCPSPQADELRLWILEQARAGATKEEVEAELFRSFGDQLRQAPRAEGIGLLAYAVPAVFQLAGGVLLAAFLRRSRGSAVS
jgi:cytochrome c-type biogenesis protein CcmH/NrfF